jgi:uncharacterized zinc-type alcohol dehydrogenase-like protein
LLTIKGLSITSSAAGGLRETQEVIDYCARKKIMPETELVDWTQLDKVYETLSAGSDRVVRYVLDIEKSFK